MIPALIVGLLSFNNYKRTIETVHLSELGNITSFKADSIETYFAGLKADIEVAKSSFAVRNNIPVLTRLSLDPDDPEFMFAKQQIDVTVQRMRKVWNLFDIMLVSPEGRIVYLSDTTNGPKNFLKVLNDPQGKAFGEGKRAIYFTDVFRDDSEGGRLVMLITDAVFDLKDVFAGTIVFKVDMAPVYKLIQDVKGLGNTGEVLIGKKEGDQVVYLMPLKYDPQAALERKIPIGDKAGLPIQEAVMGKTGTGISRDYRGAKVIASWRHIPSLGWGMVAKIDVDEAFADITGLRKIVTAILALVFVLAGVMSFSIARSISRPIKMLSKGAEIIGAGNLDYKVATGSKDEIGQLSRSFDMMTQDLKKNAMYARSLLETSLDPFVTISPEGKITDVNEATIRATGKTREELIGTDFSNYFTEPQKAQAGYRQVFAEGIVTDYPLTIRHKDGRLIDVLYNASIYKDTRGNRLGVFAAARDVTELNRAVEELKRHRDQLEAIVKERTAEVNSANRELLRSNEGLEQFAYVASHDLQEPLRTMASYSQLLEQRYKGKLDKDADEFIGFIVDAAKRMQKLITDLLAYSRVGRTDTELRETDCNSVLGRVVFSMGPVIEENKAVITHDNLPVMACNESSFIQLFQNLIGNAIKFRGEETPRVHINAKRQGDEWLFSVRDNGIGIDEKYKDRIFLIFQRLHGRDKYPGTGIGLSICKKIVESRGGRIWVESKLGEGTTFYFTVPESKGGIS